MTLTALQRQVLESVNPERLVSLLQTMVRHKSYSNTPGEGELARYMAGRMTHLGMAVDLQEVAPGRLNCIGHLRGTGGGQSLMFNGHLDTNMAGEGWTTDPWGGAVANGFIYGIGVSNMKAADAAMVEAVAALRDAGVALSGDLYVAHVIGELQGGLGTVHMLEQGVRADCFIVGEPTDLALLTLHAGAFEAQIHVTGRTRHLSKLEESVSAIDKMYEVIQALKPLRFSGAERADYRGLQRINVGVIRGGMGREYLEWRVPSVPDYCSVKIAGRVAPGQTPEGAVADIQAMLEVMMARDPDLQARAELSPSGQKLYMPPFEVDRSHPLVTAMAELYREVAEGAEPRIGDIAPYKFYGTDAAHLSHRGGMAGVVCGPGGKYNTMPDERVEILDLIRAAQLYALSALDICG